MFRASSFNDACPWCNRVRAVQVMQDHVEVERSRGLGLRKDWFISQQEA